MRRVQIEGIVQAHSLAPDPSRFKSFAGDPAYYTRYSTSELSDPTHLEQASDVTSIPPAPAATLFCEAPRKWPLSAPPRRLTGRGGTRRLRQLSVALARSASPPRHPPLPPPRKTAPAPVLERARAAPVPERASCGARRQPTAEEILAALEATDTDWSRRTLARVRQMSPASLAATIELFRRGAACGIEECLRAEFRLAYTCAPAPLA